MFSGFKKLFLIFYVFWMPDILLKDFTQRRFKTFTYTIEDTITDLLHSARATVLVENKKRKKESALSWNNDF